MNSFANTPFSEYREEQVKVNIFDYFVEPAFFESFCDTKPVLIYGSRGTGKTTLLKALTLSEAKDINDYLTRKNYIGVYHRIDLNVSTSFSGDGLNNKQWEKLYAFYFTLKISFELVSQFLQIKKYRTLDEEEEICLKYGKLFAKENDVKSIEELKTLISDQLIGARSYINNISYADYPYIGDYATIIRELPKDLSCSISTADDSKIIFFLIDEFEGLDEWQQKIILSFLKYSDKYHTYKICMRPDGLKAGDTIGGEYIRETDDVRTIDLNEMILSNKNDYYNYALDVCEKRMSLFWRKNKLIGNVPCIEELLSEISDDKEFEAIFGETKDTLIPEINEFVKVKQLDENASKYFWENPFDFYIFKLICLKHPNSQPLDIFHHVVEKDQLYRSACGNYKTSLLYYLCLKNNINKNYAGFRVLVNLSGGTLRYLLELCNVILERAVSLENFNYENPKQISAKIQSDAVLYVSSKRLKQISAVPQIGLNMRTFVIALGNIYQIFHKEEKISKFEPNHFSIKATGVQTYDDIMLFLKECVMRGVLLKINNNKSKQKFSISNDEYIYALHPIYTPYFQISWRRKQKAEFDIEEMKILISNDAAAINSLIKKYEAKYLKDNNAKTSELDFYQIQLPLDGDNNDGVF